MLAYPIFKLKYYMSNQKSIMNNNFLSFYKKDANIWSTSLKHFVYLSTCIVVNSR